MKNIVVGILLTGLRALKMEPNQKEWFLMKNKPHKKVVVHPHPLANSLAHPHPSATDPLGSWTGIPENPEELPVQDADDL